MKSTQWAIAGSCLSLGMLTSRCVEHPSASVLTRRTPVQVLHEDPLRLSTGYQQCFRDCVLSQNM